MHFLSEDLENYAYEHTDNEPPLLQELSRRTHLTVLQPRMISGWQLLVFYILSTS